MSSFVKAKLKGARDALGKKEYEVAREAAIQILEYEPENYNACVKLKSNSLQSMM
jgi:superkiller protein 3